MLSVVPSQAVAQRLPVGDADEAYLRILQISGLVDLDSSFLLRPLTMNQAGEALKAASAHPWDDRPLAESRVLPSLSLEIHDVRFSSYWSSGFPSEQNLGALVLGRGFTSAFDGGVSVKTGPLTVTVRPLIGFTQNEAFPLAAVELSDRSEYSYPWNTIDLPQRFGPDSYWTVDPGQSEIRLDIGPASVSAGTTNIWWGPGIRNAILMSNNAAGIPRIAAETNRPIKIGGARLEGQWFWGRLQESDWYDGPGAGEGRYITGGALVVSPGTEALSGLSLGMARTFVGNAPEPPYGPSRFLHVFGGHQNSGGRDGLDQHFALFLRWHLPESGFEVYAEWARDDRGRDLRDYFLNWEHSQGYTIGFQKAAGLGENRILVFRGELTHLERSSSLLVRGGLGSTVYSHSEVRQGYTQKGQVLGAFIGPGGNSQFLGFDLYSPNGSFSLFVQRRVHAQDAYLARAVREDWGPWRIHGSGMIGSKVTVFRGPWDLTGSISLDRHLNRYFELESDHNSVQLDFSVRWRVARGSSARGAQ